MPSSSPVAPRRPGKEKATEQTEINTEQMNDRQVQLEETVGMMGQEMSTIKELLERLFVPPVPATMRGDNAVEERCTEQQAAKTTRGKVASGSRTNSRQVPQSRAEATQSAIPNSKKINTKAGPSRPYNEAVSGLPPRSKTPLKSQEK